MLKNHNAVVHKKMAARTAMIQKISAMMAGLLILEMVEYDGCRQFRSFEISRSARLVKRVVRQQ
jgi:hypothetical protein